MIDDPHIHSLPTLIREEERYVMMMVMMMMTMATLIRGEER